MIRALCAGMVLMLVLLWSVWLWSETPRPSHPRRFRCVASWYGAREAGCLTASGEVFDPLGLTAACRRLPMGTRVKVTNLGNGLRVIVRVNDRGPYARGRGIDLSYAAAYAIGMVKEGLARVEVEVVK